MRSILRTRDEIDWTEILRDKYVNAIRRKRRENSYPVMGWPINQAIPSKLSDWLAYLLTYQILDKADRELKEGEVLTVRFNLGKFQMSRNLIPLFSDYPQYVSIRKVGPNRMVIWVDGRVTAVIRDGIAFGKKIYARHYDRNLYTTSRLLATQEEDIMAAMRLFPHAPHHTILNYD